MKTKRMSNRNIFSIGLVIVAGLASLAAAAMGTSLGELIAVHPSVAIALSGMAMMGDTESIVQDVKDLAKTQGTLLASSREMKAAMEKAELELKATKDVSEATKKSLEELATKSAELTDKALELERKLSEGFEKQNKGETESVGDKFSTSEEFKSVAKGSSKFARMEVKAALLNATGNAQPLVPGMRVPGIIQNPDRVLTIRDLLPVGRTASNLIQYARENVYTNNAGPQNGENVLKNESGITFALADSPVVTIAHWIPISRQVLADAPQLQSYVDSRLRYGLKLEEEDQLLNGTGLAGALSGILKVGNFTAYNRAVVGDTVIDTLRKAITQAALSNYPIDAIVINPEDWEEIELTKATDGQYIMANPAVMMGPQIWGRRVVPTTAIPQGTFLAGGFGMGAQLWDREDAAVQLSLEDGDNFRKNMATLLCEERLALTVYRPAAFVSGDFA